MLFGFFDLFFWSTVDGDHSVTVLSGIENLLSSNVDLVRPPEDAPNLLFDFPELFLFVMDFFSIVWKALFL